MNGLLLVNLGSPAAPTTPAVTTYLRQFLSDRNVIEMSPTVWQPLLEKMILPRRAWHSAALYRRVWTPAGSPLTAYTAFMARQVQTLLPDWRVDYAMTYGQPAIAPTLQQLARTCDKIVVLPLFPQFTQSTHAGIFQQVAATGIPVTMIHHFYDEPDYLAILADQISHAAQQADYDAILLSYHGIPQAMVNHGDPYEAACLATTQAVLDRLPDTLSARVQTVFQSRFGPMPWLQPYLNKTLVKLAKSGKRNVLVATPSFVADCLETLEEDGHENRDVFLKNGGLNYQLVPPMNDDSRFTHFLAELAQRQLSKNSCN